MSARNHADCPQCRKNFAAKLKAKHEAITEQYGKIPEDEYQKQIDDLKLWRDEHKHDHLEMLAEYYEHWFEDGRFKARYRAVCDECGFEHDMANVNEKCELA